MKNRTIIPYNPKLKELARELRNNSTKSEIYLWKHLKGKQRCGYDFHRQKPLGNYVVDFFCNELMLAIELDGYSHLIDEIKEKDAVKEKAITELGVSMLRFSNQEVSNRIDNVTRAIEAYIKEWEEIHGGLE